MAADRTTWFRRFMLAAIVVSILWATSIYSAWLFVGPLFVSDAAFQAHTQAFFSGLFGFVLNLAGLRFGAAFASFSLVRWTAPTTWMYLVALAPIHVLVFGHVLRLVSQRAPLLGGATGDGA